MAQTFEVVYYAHPTPRDLATLTWLGLLFDRVHFPGVYIPREFDTKALIEEIRRIEDLPGNRDLESYQMVACMRMALMRGYIDDFCFFTGDSKDVFGTVDPQAAPLSMQLLQTIHGPFQSGFIPTYIPGYHKGFPGTNDGLGVPSPATYLANALIYAHRHDLPILNDAPGLPVIGVAPPSDAQIEKTLSTIAAIQTLKLALPGAPIMHPESLHEFRVANAEHLRRFRVGMARCTRELMAALRAGEREEYLVSLAEKIAMEDVKPQLEDLRSAYSRRGAPWYEDASNIGIVSAQLAGAFHSATTGDATSMALSALLPFLVGIQRGRDRKEDLTRSSLFYLLAIEKAEKV